jgi:hypothetical protein
MVDSPRDPSIASSVGSVNPTPSPRVTFDDEVRRGNSPQTNGTGMTQDPFRQEIQRQMEQFRQADAANRATRLDIRVPQGNPTPPIGDVPPAGVRPQTPYATYAPRNGYDEYGNRADSTRRRYDEDGNDAQPPRPAYRTAIGNASADSFWQQPAPQTAAPQRQNRVYYGDGSSRPIGRQSNAASQFQAIYNQSQAQMARQQAGRNSSGAGQYAPASVPVPSPTSVSTSATYAPNRLVSVESAPQQSLVMNDSAPRSSPRITFDDRVPRRATTTAGNGGSRYSYDENARATAPAPIRPRPSGQSAATASVRF